MFPTTTRRRARSMTVGLVSGALIALTQASTHATPSSRYDLLVPVPSPTAIDTSNRQAVIDAFRSRWIPAFSTPGEAIGDTTTCTAGVPSAQVMAGALNMVNFARDLVGSPHVTFTAEKNLLAQQASLTMAASGVMTHYPDPAMACYSDAGARGARESNIAAGYRIGDGVSSIRLWLESSKGHRDWVLDPGVPSMGFGAVTKTGTQIGASALHVIDPAMAYRASGGIPWPVAGYFPEELIRDTEAWNYSFSNGYPQVETNSATVTLTRLTPAGAVNVPVTVKDPGKYSSKVYFTPQAGWLRPTTAGSDVTYQVHIGGLSQWVSGDEDDYLEPIPDVVYTTTLVTAREPGTTLDGLPQPADPTHDGDVAGSGGKLTVTGKVKFKGLVKGTAKVGRKVTAVLPKFNHKVATTTRWYRNGKLLKKVKGGKYTPKRADAGKRLQVKVTAAWNGQRVVAKSSKVRVTR